MKNRPLLFYHIPKTGGSTLFGIIKYKYFFNKNSFITVISQTLPIFKELSQEKRNKLKAIEVYKGLEEVYSLFSHKPFCITLLRNPVDRVISHYYYLRHGLEPESPMYPQVLKYSLKDFVQNDIFKNMENYQVRALSGNFDIPHGTCSKKMLSMAIKKIDEQFELVGTTDYFDEFLILLMDKLGWRYPFYTRINSNPFKPKQNSIDESTIRIIEQYNQLDIELYQYVKTKFEDIMNKMDGSYYKKLNSFKTINKQLVPFLKIAKSIKEIINKKK